MIKYLLLSFVIVIVMVGCSSAPQTVHYYLLEGAVKSSTEKEVKGDHFRVTLTTLRMADYLQQSSLVLLQNQHRINFAKNHVWAENMASGIERLLVGDFNKAGPSQLMLAGEPGVEKNEYQLILQIDHFLPTDQGQVILAGQYWLKHKKELVSSHHFYFDEPLNEDGYAHAVSKQRKLIDQLAQALVANVKAL